MKRLEGFKILFSLSVLLITAIILSGCARTDGTGNSGFFLYDNELLCYVATDQSSDNTGDSYKGQTITITGLLGEEQRVIYPHGGSSPMEKIYDSESQVTIQLVASGSGSTDTFTINKKTGEFTETGQGNVGGPYFFTRSGTCK